MNWTQRPEAAPLLARLRQSPGFGADDLAAFGALAAEVRTFDPDAPIVVDGGRSDRLHVVLNGWAARFKILENGSRQIPALSLAGDFCDLDRLYLERADWGVVASTRCTVASLPRDALAAAIEGYRGVREAIGRMAGIENGIVTQWSVCLGRRSARERLAHLFCELHARLEAVGVAQEDGYALPLTQEEVADVLGLTAVHVNRTLQRMRAEGLVVLRDHRLTIPDRRALRRVGGFDGRYLHLPCFEPGAAAAGRAPDGAMPAYA